MPPPRGLVQLFDQHLHRSGLLAPGSRLLIGCSGGADSVALLRLLQAVNGGRHWQFTLIVGHVNHRTRGKASDADAAFVKRLAGKLGLPFVSRMLRLRQGKSSEALLREERLAALVSMTRATRCDAIVLAHHADDQAETVLMRILRGTALHGLGGIAASRYIEARFVRPLLPFGRQTLRDYLKGLGQQWREDKSNENADYLRNRVRRDLLPLMEAMQPQAKASLVRLAAHAQESQDLVENIVETVAERAGLTCLPRRNPTRAVLQRATLRLEPTVVLGELFRQIVARIGGSLNALTAERLAAAVRMAIGRAGGKAIELGAGVVVKSSGRSIIFARKST